MMNPSHLKGIRLALEHGGDTHSIGDVIRKILSGDAQLWETQDAVIVTEIHDTPRLRTVHFWLATGDLDAVIELSHRVMAWAKKEYGCRGATLAGRKGWLRVLQEDGWRPSPLIHMEREI